MVLSLIVFGQDVCILSYKRGEGYQPIWEPNQHLVKKLPLPSIFLKDIVDS